MPSRRCSRRWTDRSYARGLHGAIQEPIIRLNQRGVVANDVYASRQIGQDRHRTGGTVQAIRGAAVGRTAGAECAVEETVSCRDGLRRVPPAEQREGVQHGEYRRGSMAVPARTRIEPEKRARPWSIRSRLRRCASPPASKGRSSGLRKSVEQAVGPERQPCLLGDAVDVAVEDTNPLVGERPTGARSQAEQRAERVSSVWVRRVGDAVEMPVAAGNERPWTMAVQAVVGPRHPSTGARRAWSPACSGRSCQRPRGHLGTPIRYRLPSTPRTSSPRLEPSAALNSRTAVTSPLPGSKK